MQIKRSISLVLLFPLGVLANKTFNSNGLSSNKRPPEQKLESIEETQKNRKNDPKKKFQPGIDQQGDLKKIETQIKAINLIIKTETDSQKKIDLFIRRSQLYISAARTLGLNRTRLADMKPAEKKYLEAANKTLNDLLKFSKGKPRRLASIYYLLGLVNYEYEHFDKVRDYFINAVKLDLRNPLATTMALMVGELDYDKDRYAEAIKGYQWLYKQMTPREKALADYKTGWSYIGLTDMDNAKKYLVRVIKVNGEPSFVEDSIRDLAFIVAQKDDEEYSIKYGNDNFQNPAQRSKFFYSSLVYFLQKDKKKSRQPLFMELLAVEKDPLQRARILALKVSYERKEFPTVEAFKAMAEMDTHVKQMDPAIKEKFFFQEGIALEDNSEAIIKNFVDAYMGRLTTPQKLPKDYVITAMKKLIEIHLRLFPNSTKQDQIYALWMDACFDSKDIACLVQLKPLFKEKAQKNKAFEPLYPLAGIKILTLVDENYEKNPQVHEGELLNLISEFIKENPNYPDNTKLIRKATSLMLKKEQYKEAMPWLEQLYKIDPQGDALKTLLFAKFKLGLHDEIVHHPGVQKSKDKNVMDIYRESSLILAQKNLEGNNFDAYEANLKKFLASNPDQKKATLAYVDYFDRLIKAQKYDLFMKEWKSITPTMKESKDFLPIRSAALGGMMSDGYFVDEPFLLKASDDQSLHFNTLVYQRALGKPFNKKEFDTVRKLSPDKRNYIYNLILVTNPRLMIELLSTQKKLDMDEKRFLYTGYLLAKGDDNFVFTEAQLKPMRDIVPKKMLPTEKSKIFGEFDKVRPPKAGISANKYEAQVQAVMEHARKMRKRVSKEIGKLPTQDKINVLQAAIDLEKGTAEAIKGSPLPPNLDEKQQVEYQTAIAEIAKEFENQAEEFVKSKTEIDVKNQVEEEDVAKQRLPSVRPEDLPSPSSGANFSTAEELFKKAPIASLIYWDSQFSTKKIDDENYYKGRSKLLVKIGNTQSMRDLIASELRTAQQEALLKKWKGSAE